MAANIDTKEDKNLRSWMDIIPEQTAMKLDKLMWEDDEMRNEGLVIYPPHNEILNALRLTGYDDVKAVIIGQDPYHEKGQAMGLSFSVKEGVKIPPSLRNIFKVYQKDLGYEIPKSGDLTKWAREGVLLLNAVLTVEDGKANSHKDIGWMEITKEIVKSVLKKEEKTVFLIWGNQALKIVEDASSGIEIKNKKMLISTHPSPLSANRSSAGLKAFMDS